MNDDRCPTCDRDHCPCDTVACARYPDNEPGTCCRACAPWDAADADCQRHAVSWRERALAAEADRDALQARLDAAGLPLWLAGPDGVSQLLRRNRVVAHVRALPRSGWCWAVGEYAPQSETEYTRAPGGTLLAAQRVVEYVMLLPQSAALTGEGGQT